MPTRKPYIADVYMEANVPFGVELSDYERRELAMGRVPRRVMRQISEVCAIADHQVTGPWAITAIAGANPDDNLHAEFYPEN